MGQTGRRLNVRIKEHAKKYTMKDEKFITIHTLKIRTIILFSLMLKYWILKLIEEKDIFRSITHTHTNKLYEQQFEISKLSNQYTPLIKICEFMRL